MIVVTIPQDLHFCEKILEEFGFLCVWRESGEMEFQRDRFFADGEENKLKLKLADSIFTFRERSIG